MRLFKTAIKRIIVNECGKNTEKKSCTLSLAIKFYEVKSNYEI
jgi:hypothetical protein